MVLFGSHARGEASPESDDDIAVVLDGPLGFGAEAMMIADIEADILFETGAVINALPFRSGAYSARTGLVGAVRRDGRDL